VRTCWPLLGLTLRIAFVCVMRCRALDLAPKEEAPHILSQRGKAYCMMKNYKLVRLARVMLWRTSLPCSCVDSLCFVWSPQGAVDFLRLSQLDETDPVCTCPALRLPSPSFVSNVANLLCPQVVFNQLALAYSHLGSFIQGFECFLRSLRLKPTVRCFTSVGALAIFHLPSCSSLPPSV